MGRSCQAALRPSRLAGKLVTVNCQESTRETRDIDGSNLRRFATTRIASRHTSYRTRLATGPHQAMTCHTRHGWLLGHQNQPDQRKQLEDFSVFVRGGITYGEGECGARAFSRGVPTPPVCVVVAGAVPHAAGLAAGWWGCVFGWPAVVWLWVVSAPRVVDDGGAAVGGWLGWCVRVAAELAVAAVVCRVACSCGAVVVLVVVMVWPVVGAGPVADQPCPGGWAVVGRFEKVILKRWWHR